MHSRPLIETSAFVLLAVLAVAVWYVAHRDDSGVSADRPNVILISIDTCRADYLGCYNPDWTTTPNIDAFAESATVFTNVVAPAPMTLPSHASMLTGQIPLAHGVHDNGQLIPDENRMLAEILFDNGYATAAYVSTTVLARQFGLGQGFDVYYDSMEVAGQLQHERTADQTTALVIDWLRWRDPLKPFFLFVHFYDPHAPYTPPEPFASVFDDPYAGEIASVDAAIGRLVETLKVEGIYDDAVVIVTGDHGEMLGEHGEPDHGYYIYESAIKVPLILKHPGQESPQRVESIVGLVDVVPTICSLTGVEAPPNLTGLDISGRADSIAPARSLYIQSPYPQILFDTNPLLGLVDDRWKYLFTSSPELYDLRADPGELTNLIDAEPRQARVMRDVLDEVITGVATALSATPAATDPQTRRMLESLGYTGSGQQQANLTIDPDKADPKDMIGVYAEFHRVKELRDSGRTDEATEMCLALAKDQPDARGIQWAAADLLVQAGRYEEAQAPCERLDAISPDDPNTHVMKGIIYSRLGRLAEGRAELLRAVEQDPTLFRAQRELGDTCMLLGLYPQAETAYLAALKLDDRNLRAMNNLACLYVDYLDQPAKALPLAERALMLADDVPIINDTVGWVLANVGRYDEAHALLVAAVAEYSVAETRYHLGWVLEKLNRPAEAMAEYETARQLLGENEDDPIYPKVIDGLARVAAP